MTDTPCLGASDAHVRSAQAILSGMTTDLNFVMVVQVDSECVSLWESLRPPAACLWCPPSDSALSLVEYQADVSVIHQSDHDMTISSRISLI